MGCSPFARRYSGNHSCFLFLRVLRCFSSPGPSLYDYLFILEMTSLSRCRVSPFGYRRVFASLQLGAAFRSSVRPSSVSSGQASSVRPCLLDQLVLFFSSMCFLQDFLLSKTVFLLLFSQCLFFSTTCFKTSSLFVVSFLQICVSGFQRSNSGGRSSKT